MARWIRGRGFIGGIEEVGGWGREAGRAGALEIAEGQGRAGQAAAGGDGLREIKMRGCLVLCRSVGSSGQKNARAVRPFRLLAATVGAHTRSGGGAPPALFGLWVSAGVLVSFFFCFHRNILCILQQGKATAHWCTSVSR
jgi:hypothetical protein